MTVAFDAFSSETNPVLSWEYTPVGSPWGVLVALIHQNTAAAVEG
jgi:hypothetical protein